MCRSEERHSARLLPAQCRFDGSTQSAVVGTAFDELAIDQEGGRATYTFLLAFQCFLPHFVTVFSCVQALVKLRRIQVQISSKAFEVLLVVRAYIFASLLLEQLIVIVPETSLFIGTLRRLRGPAGFLADKSKMAEIEANLTGIDILLFEPTRRAGGKLPAIRSLKVAILRDHNCSIFGADTPIQHYLHGLVYRFGWLCFVIVLLCEKGQESNDCYYHEERSEQFHRC